MVEEKDRQPLSEAQLEIMNLVWGRKEVTVSEVWRELKKRRRVARNTIQTLMTRLEEKGWLRHREEGNRFLYSALPKRSKVLGQMVSQLVETAFDGSAEELMLALLDSRGISGDEAERIRKIIEEAEEAES